MTRSAITVVLLLDLGLKTWAARELTASQSTDFALAARALSALVEVTLEVDENAPCIDPACPVPDCGNAGADA